MPSLSFFIREGLELDFSKEEILKALHDYCGDKSPGQMVWLWLSSRRIGTLLGMNFFRTFSEFFHIGKFLESLNITFIGLIPKKANVENIGDFGRMHLQASF